MLIANTERGLHCARGDFYVDPWQPVDVAVITHAHSDHARSGSRLYLAEESSKPILEQRLAPDANIQTLRYGETLSRNGVTISLHPAGHILGSAQVRIEAGGEIAVVSGDYKVQPDHTCRSFEPIRCHTFVTESTFGLPIYRWPETSDVFRDIHAWWRENQARERTSVIFCYALGKAQRLLAGLDPSVGPIFVHGAVERYLPAYRAAGVAFPVAQWAAADLVKQAKVRALVLAPTSADNSPWLRKFGEISTAFASGWMQIRGTRRRRSLDRGFALSDHADWPGLLNAIAATQADNVLVTHGYTAALARWLQEHRKNATALETRFHGELEDEPEKAA